MPNPALSLTPNDFTEKKLRRLLNCEHPDRVDYYCTPRTNYIDEAGEVYPAFTCGRKPTDDEIRAYKLQDKAIKQAQQEAQLKAEELQDKAIKQAQSIVIEKKLAQKKLIESKALQFNQEQAAKGEPGGLLRMGERYRDGEGVAKDLIKAREYLKRAADAGLPTAAAELDALPSH